MSLHDLIELLEGSGIEHETAFRIAFYHVYDRRSGADRREQPKEST